MKKQMELHLHDKVELKKPHPCGAKEFLVLRSGMDFRIRCTGCGHEVMVPRVKAEKNIRQITREGVIVYPPEKNPAGKPAADKGEQ